MLIPHLERAVRLCPYDLFSVQGQTMFAVYAGSGSISAKFCVYIVQMIPNDGLPSIDEGDLGFGVKHFEECSTSCALLYPSMTDDQAAAEIKRAAEALEK